MRKNNNGRSSILNKIHEKTNNANPDIVGIRLNPLQNKTVRYLINAVINLTNNNEKCDASHFGRQFCFIFNDVTVEQTGI